MKLDRVLVVYKRSTFDLYNNEEYNPNVKKLIDEGHVSVKSLKDSHNVHQNTVDNIIEVLSHKNIHLDVIFRGDLKPIEDYDIVVTTGGDGTILETSKYVKDIPILGVNSDPVGSVGFFTGATKDDFSDKIDLLLDDKLKKISINRIQLKLNGEPIKDLVLNDVLITHSIPAATSRYIINLKGQTENHRSSGMWISTAAGSTAAIRSAGGFPLPITSDAIQYIVREFYDRGSNKFKLLGGVFNFEDGLEIISQMRLGKFYIDGPYFDYPFTVGDSLTFHKSKFPITLLGFDNSKRESFLKKHNS
ncbi:MAG: NAD(+)/NADH kinase [Candidatus Sericytochromatia bacterium]|nr:NAD(+)/NADH kinase [Candidatus Sericytochromatia bacterium]